MEFQPHRRSKSRMSSSMDHVKFKVNGVEYSVGSEVSSDTTLLDYIRSVLKLPGTKYMCREAGCGACIVSALKCPGAPNTSVNSCMVSVTSCQDWDITTIEYLGNRLKGYHLIQTTLADNHGSQCGYCSPGWIMAMNSKKKLTMLEIEQSLSSNICRCTGYRSILHAFKKFAIDCPSKLVLDDIEDLNKCKSLNVGCSKNNCEAHEWCFVSKNDVQEQSMIYIKLEDDRKWFRVETLNEVFNILKTNANESFMFVAGNTAKGIYPINQYPRILIDISALKEIRDIALDQNVVLGAGLTITEMMEEFRDLSKKGSFEYLSRLNEHLKLVGHISVRNIGTVAGNLMMKHEHPEFPSDIFLLFTTVGAQLTILNSSGVKRTVTMEDFLKVNMVGYIIISVFLPPLSKGYKLVTFKILPRAQSARVIINAGFLYKLQSGVVEEVRIVYGGLSQHFIRAKSTEKYLTGKSLFTNATLHESLCTLDTELIITENLHDASVIYRRKLALSLFYKGLLTLCPAEVLNPRYCSGSIKLKESRPLSKGRQIFDTDTSIWPLNQPIRKLEALVQCAGEAQYIEDIPPMPFEVFGAFVMSTVSLGDIENIDPTEALNTKGVLAFYTAKDIPGVNSFTPAGYFLTPKDEEILCNGNVKYYNQPIGIIVANTRSIAEKASKLITVKYKNIKKPIIDIKIAKKFTNRNTLFNHLPQTDRGGDIVKVIKGSNTIYSQYHFCMETSVCVARPTEEGIEMYASTQWMNGLQVSASRALNLPENKIDIHVRRLGGGFGFKITRSHQAAIACSLVVLKLNRPCRFIQPLTTNMRAVGKRLPCSTDFEVGVNAEGVVQYMNYELYDDHGYIVNEPFLLLATDVYNNCYEKSRWNYKAYDTTTDTASNTWCRSPGSFESITMVEWILERISTELSLDSFQVRLSNVDPSIKNDLVEVANTIKENSKYYERREAVNKFNKENRWMKRGLRVALMKWIPIGRFYLDINMSVYHDDGTISLTHSGIEMGQGINTKAAQICAYFLKVPIEKVQIKPNSTINSPNGFISGGSLTSQYVGVGVKKCCEKFLKRLKPIRKEMKNPTWEELIKKAFEANIDLQTHAFVNAADVQNYKIFGTTVAEVEVDILTGQTEIVRVDLLEDTGRSISPEIDIGQVEGAFVMGLGYWTCENLVYDPNTGELLTDRTWNYSVPQARDIPQDFRIYFRKNSYSTDLILGSKATAEPPTCMSVVIPFAIREAIASARFENGIPTTQWFDIDGPYTVEKICLAAETNFNDFKFY